MTGEVGEILDRTRIEVIYNCNKDKKSDVKVTMKIEPDHCLPFELVWIKSCKDKGKLLNKN